MDTFVNMSVDIPFSDKSLFTRLMEKMGWRVHEKEEQTKLLSEEDKVALDAIMSFAGSLKGGQSADWKKAKEEYLREKYEEGLS